MEPQSAQAVPWGQRGLPRVKEKGRQNLRSIFGNKSKGKGIIPLLPVSRSPTGAGSFQQWRPQRFPVGAVLLSMPGGIVMDKPLVGPRQEGGAALQALRLSDQAETVSARMTTENAQNVSSGLEPFDCDQVSLEAAAAQAGWRRHLLLGISHFSVSPSGPISTRRRNVPQPSC
jgi:hypothetical protein